MNYSGFPGWAEDHTALAMVLTPLLAVPVALLLGWPPLAARLAVVVDPVGAWRRRVDAAPSSA